MNLKQEYRIFCKIGYLAIIVGSLLKDTPLMTFGMVALVYSTFFEWLIKRREKRAKRADDQS